MGHGRPQTKKNKFEAGYAGLTGVCMSKFPTTLLLAAGVLSLAIAIKSATAAHDGPLPQVEVARSAPPAAS